MPRDTSWLFVRKGEFHLAVACEGEDPEASDPEGVLGVDLGQVNLATDSTGEHFSGEKLTQVRPRDAKLRRSGPMDKGNRKSQAEFSCRSWGFSDHADRVTAVTIAARAAVNRPLVGWHGPQSPVATAS